ncbi:MAG: polysaccharide biosynthesis C-terminal domain-containing protein, partial [Nitrospira sp.]|nr:polysaccharide biosynthesis C-terminal domain-containing protein [Nitrospira sp.]
ERWLPSADPLRIVALAGLFICIGHPCGAVLAAMNRLGSEVWVHLSQGILVSIACYFGLQHWGIIGAAWAVFAGIAYSTPVMYFLATRCFKAALPDLLVALAPGLKLNLILLLGLAFMHNLLPTGWRESQPALYLLLAGGFGAVCYAGAFLFAPGQALSDEAMRWRKLLHLAR